MHDGHNLFDEFYSNFQSEWGISLFLNRWIFLIDECWMFVGIDESIERNFQESKETSIVVGIENKGIGVDPNGFINF